ncbi:MAG: isoleucine--tRNA ligase [Pseudomonadota bacterium]
MYKRLLVNIVDDEKEIFYFWSKNNIFLQSLKKGDKDFIFYDGPPFGNGMPHYGHLATGFIKDIIPRYKTMKGFHVRRAFGWDCHGLPAEMYVEGQIKIHGKKQIIQKIGKKEFNDLCRKSVLKYENEWEKYVTRQARWVDFNNSYKTMDIDYMESVVWAFKNLYDKGLCYEATRIMPYSWKCGTALSNFETRMDGAYRETTSTSVVVKFQLHTDALLDNHIFKNLDYNNVYVLAWTTTPWTLISHLALAVNTTIEYALLKKDSNIYIVAKNLVSLYHHELGDNCIATCLGKDLLKLTYTPLFDYFIGVKNAFCILAGDNFVTSENGTGIVHMAPGFGEDDHKLCVANNIKVVCPINDAGVFTNEVRDFAGKLVFDSIPEVIRILKEQKKIVKIEPYKHNYPFCWRTDTPIIYRAVSSWYVNVVKIKERLISCAKEINWMNNEVKNGMLAWLENARDWSISRNRLWGTPLLIWKSNDPLYPYMKIFGSIKELEDFFEVQITDLHTDFIDQLTKANPADPTGKSKLVRIDDIFDCWFESGCMPFAQLHYPFKNKDWFEKNFPADFITEYVGQTRGWFYTLLVLGVALFDKIPFKNCLPHGIILDENSKKLSKRLRNYPDPYDIFEKFGSDAMRSTILSSSLVLGGNLCIDSQGKIFQDSCRSMIAPIRNAYSFFTLYANTYKVKCDLIIESKEIMNKYILSKLKTAVKNIDDYLLNFKIYESYKVIIDFMEILNNWYIRRNRNIFRYMPSLHSLLNDMGFNSVDLQNMNENDMNIQLLKHDNVKEYFDTLFTCLFVFAHAIAPLLPLLSEQIYKNLEFLLKDLNSDLLSKFDINNTVNSVHLQNFPNVEALQSDIDLENIMDKYIDICTAVRMLRNENACPLRTPLNKITIVNSMNSKVNVKANLDVLLKDIILDELNIKDIQYENNIEQYADRKLQLNFKEIAKRIPSQIKDILKNKNSYVIEGNNLNINGNVIFASEFNLSWVLKEQYKTVARIVNDQVLIVDFTSNSALAAESIIRDIIRSIQMLRGEIGLMMSNVVGIDIMANEKVLLVLNRYQMLIDQYTNSRLKIVSSDDIKNNIYDISKECELGYALYYKK